MALPLANSTQSLTPLDWTVIGGYALGIIGIGFFFARRARTSDDYHLGGRNMRPWAVGLSLFATLLSTVSYLAVPSEMIHRGPMVLFGMASYPLIIAIVGWVLIPRIMRFPVTTAYEILEHRLGLTPRLTGAAIFIAIRLLWMATIIYVTADKVLVPLAGLNANATPLVCCAMGLVTLVYTSMGGLRAVVWTDVLQSFILVSAAIACVVVISGKIGGIEHWWPNQWAPHWETFQFLPDGSPHLSFLDMFLATLVWYVCTAGSDQMAVQRYLATRDARSARRAYVMSMGTDVVSLLICAILGFALLGYYTAHHAELPAGQSVASYSDQLFPQFILTGLPSGITGLVVAGLLAAAMSSLSSGMNSISSVVTIDFIKRFRNPDERSLVTLSRVISVIVGVVTVLLSFGYVSRVQGNLLQVAYKVTNLLTGPLFVLFFMALFVPWARAGGTLIGVATSILVAIQVAYWTELTGRPGIAFTWILPLALASGVLVACIASVIPVGRSRSLRATPPLIAASLSSEESS